MSPKSEDTTIIPQRKFWPNRQDKLGSTQFSLKLKDKIPNLNKGLDDLDITSLNFKTSVPGN